MIKCIRNNVNYNNLPFFAGEDYLKTMSDDYGWFVSENFLLPFIVRKKYIFKYLTFTNETIYLSDINDINSEKNFLNEVIDFIDKTEYDFVTQPPTNVLFNIYPDKSNYCDFGSYIIELKQSEDMIFNNIHSKHKNVIRKALKDEVFIERGFQFKDICYNIIKDTLSRQGLTFMSESEFENLVNSTKNKLEFFVAKRNDVYEGAAIIPWDKFTAYYLYGGSMQNHHLGSMNLLHWEAIKYFKNENVENYNFVGARIITDKETKIHGIQDFKKRFGGNLKQGYLWKYSKSPYKKQLFDSLIFLKTGKKTKDIIDNEGKKIK